MNLAARLALAGMTAALSACMPSDPAQAPSHRLPADLGYGELVRGMANFCNGAQPTLIRNEADWQAFWAAVQPDEPVPAVDFATDSVLASCVSLPSPGYRHEIAAWRESAPGQLTVDTVVVAFACGLYPQVVVAGYHAIRIDGVFDSADFVKGSAVGESCDLGDGTFGWETLDYGQWSGCGEPADVVIGTEEAWQSFWSSLHATSSPQPERPAVDFATESVIATCLGERPDGGYVTYLKHLSEPDASGNVVVDGTEIVAGPTCTVTQAVTQPYHVIRVNRVVNGATFRRLTLESSCA
jgi:hypothetical protein